MSSDSRVGGAELMEMGQEGEAGVPQAVVSEGLVVSQVHLWGTKTCRSCATSGR